MNRLNNVVRLLDLAIERAIDRFGRQGWHKIGMDFRFALICQEVLTIMAQQDSDISPERFRELFDEIYDKLRQFSPS